MCIDLVIVAVPEHKAQGAHGVVAVPAEQAGIGINFHSLHIRACGQVGFYQQLGGRDGIQGEGINLTGAVLVAVEGAFCIAGQGVGAHVDGADLLGRAGELIHGIQNSIGNRIDHAVGRVVGHIRGDDVHLTHRRQIGELILRRYIQEPVFVGDKGDMIHNGSGEIDLRCGGPSFQRMVRLPVEADPGAQLHIKSDALGQGLLLTQLQLYFISGHVHGIVGDLQQELLPADAVHAHGVLVALAGLGVGLGSGIGQNAGAAGIVQNRSGHIPVIAGRDGEGIAREAQGDILQNGSRVVHRGYRGQRGAVAHGVPIHRAVGLQIILRRQGQSNLYLVALRQALRGPVGVEVIAGVHPAAAVAVVVSGGDCAGEGFRQGLPGGHIGHAESGGSRIPDGHKGRAGDFVAIDGIDGVALRHVNFVGNQGVAAEDILVGGIVGVGNGKGVGLGIGHVGRPDILPGGKLLGRADVEHGHIRPVAVIGQHGDGVAGAGHTLGIGQGLGKHERLHISAAGVVLVQVSLLFLCELHGNRDVDALAGRHSHRIFAQLIEEQVGIVGIHIAVVVHIGKLYGVDGIPCAGDIVQKGLGIVGIHRSVAVKVTVAHLAGRVHDLAVGAPGDLGIQRCGEGVHEQSGLVLAHVGIGVGPERILGKQACGQSVHLTLVGNVVDVEAEAVFARPVGIVAQLRFHLAVGHAVDGDVRIRAGRRSRVGQTCALLQNGVVIAVGVLERSRRGHHQTLRQSAVRDAGLRQLILLNVLLHQSGNTADLGSRHRGAAHQFVLIGCRNGAVQGVDAAAGRDDLRLHAQITGDAPRAELADGKRLRIIVDDRRLFADGNLTGEIAAGIHGILPDVLTGILGNGDTGLRLGIVAQVQIDDARLIVVNDGCNGAGRHSSLGLLKEGCGAPGAEDHFPRDVNPLKIGRLAHTIDKHVVQVGTAAVGRGIQSGERFVGVLRLTVHKAPTGHLESGAYAAVIVYRGNGKGVGVAAGRTAGVVVGGFQIGIADGARHLRPVALITGGHNHHGVGVHQAVQDILVCTVGGHTGGGGTQRQVHGIAAQNDRVFNGGHIVGIIRAAGLAEDLHDNDLGVGRVAHYAHRVHGRDIVVAGLHQTVRHRDAGHVGAVLAGAVVVMGHVQVLVNIVVSKGGLQVQIQICGGDLRRTLRNVELTQLLRHLGLVHHINGSQIILILHVVVAGVLRQSYGQSIGIHGLVVPIQAGVDDGHPHACAGVAGLPGQVGTRHLGGNGHVGLCSVCGLGFVFCLQNHLLYAGERFDFCNLTIFHIGRDDVGRQRQVPRHVQLLTNGLFNGIGQFGLLILEVFPIRHCRSVFCNVHGGEARFQSGLLLQNDGYADHVGIRIIRFIGLLLRNFLQQAFGDCAVVYLLEVDACVAAGSADGYGKAGQQRNHQQKRKQTGRQMHFLHTRSPFRVFTGLRRHFISTRFPARDIRPLLPPTGIFWKNDLLY